jgi:lantibiotic leader peptide-processing serine protease
MGTRRKGWWVPLAALFAVLVACSPMQDDFAAVGHWTDLDDGSAILATFADEESVGTLSTGPGRYILSRNGALRNLEAFVRGRGDTLVQHMPEAGFAVVETNAPSAYTRFADVVLADRVIQWRDPTTTVAFEADVSDPPFSGSADFFFDLQWGHVPVRATAAWEAGVRGDGVRVAILDGGFDLTHPDLAPNIDLSRSANFVPGEALQYGLPDPFSHGSHVAGTVAAAQNDFGIIGVAPDADLVLVKVLSDAGSGAFSWVAGGMIHAADVGADIANMSLGAAIPQSGIPGDITAREVAELRVLMQRVTNYGTWKGTLYITSAGNAGLDRDTTSDLLVLPADVNRMVSVSATAPIGWATDPLDTFFENRASYTNYGRSAIDVSAPGGDFVYPGDENCTVAGLVRPCWVFDLVFSTGNGSWYWSAGTSMAAPHASGVAALILSETPSLRGNPARLERELYRRAESIGASGQDPVHGRGAVRSGY